MWICVGECATCWRHTRLADQLVLSCTLAQLAMPCKKAPSWGVTTNCQALALPAGPHAPGPTPDT